MVSKKNRANFAAMTLVERISVDIETISWLWGGLVVDVHNGKFLREHNDLDYLTKDLHQLKSQFSRSFLELGWETENLENGDLRCEKDDVKIHFGHVVFSENVKWTHNGEKGSLVFPVSWLPIKATAFYETNVHVVLPELQYVLKTHPQLLNPEWQTRNKDISDLKVLEQILTKRGVEISTLRAMVTDV
jgi:hypothetical protein